MSSSQWLWPVDSKRMTCAFADIEYHSSWHRGIDISCDKVEVYASRNGKISLIGENEKRGKYVVIDHEDGNYSIYQHLSKNDNKKVGNYVEQGDVIGKAGDTGTGVTGIHLHFEIWKLSGKGKVTKYDQIPYGNAEAIINTNPKTNNKVYATKSDDHKTGFKIKLKQGGGIAEANLVKGSQAINTETVYVSDQYGIEYKFR